MASGKGSDDGLKPEQRERIEQARRQAEQATGMRFWVRIGPFSMDPRIETERLLTNLIDEPHEAGVLILLSPGERRLEIMTTAAAKRRLSDQSVGLAVLTMTSSFGVGDLVGGLLNGLRQLSDSAGHAEGFNASTHRDSGRTPISERGVEHSSDEPLSRPPEPIES